MIKSMIHDTQNKNCSTVILSSECFSFCSGGDILMGLFGCDKIKEMNEDGRLEI